MHRLVALGVVAGCGTAPVAAAPGSGIVWSPVIDSHVHLALWPVADELAKNGVLGAVDLGEPERALGGTLPIKVLAAGPMLTHGGGYPLDAWGSDGYGVGCDDAACVRATIDRLATEGAAVIKLALDDDGLAPALVPVAVAAAHAHHLKVAVHALSDASARLAGRAGADVLAHTPVEPLAPETIALWRGRAVISTLAAFGGRASAVANLRALRAAGVTVLYGTDLGNQRDAGPSADEIELLRAAGLDDAAITAAMTTTPAAYWGFTFGGGGSPPAGSAAEGRGGSFDLRVGPTATLLMLDRDPRRDATALLSPRAVYLHGHRIR